MTPLSLNQLEAAAVGRRRKRVGRGNASRGSYSGRGAKGQRSRTGGRRGLIRRSLRSLMERVSKQRGFRSRHAKLVVINVGALDRAFAVGDVITTADLVRRGLIVTDRYGVKVLGQGTLSKALTVRAQAFAAAARKTIEAAGGTCIVLGQPPAPPPKAAKP